VFLREHTKVMLQIEGLRKVQLIGCRGGRDCVADEFGQLVFFAA